MSWRATSFQLRTGALCHHLAMYVCSAVRVEPVARPRLLTSLNSAAHWALPRSGGGTLRNCEELSMRNGVTPPAHGVGSRIGAPAALRSGCQWPTVASGSHWESPNRPSPTLASSIAVAAAWPIAMPLFLEAPPSIASSEAAYSEASVARRAPPTRERSPVGCRRDELREHVVRRRCDGSVDRGGRTGTLLEQVRLEFLLADRVDRVVHGALHHAHVDLEGRRRPAVRPRNGNERRRRDLVPVSDLTGVGSGRWRGRYTDADERGQERSDRHRDEHDGSSAGHRRPR